MNTKKYIGTKLVEAAPMSANDAEECGFKTGGKTCDGYWIRYEDGYESWSPKDVFEKAYKVADTFKDRLHIEQQDLAEKLSKLCAFVDTPKLEEVVKDEHQRDLLLQQRDYMGEYLNILTQRIKSLE